MGYTQCAACVTNIKINVLNSAEDTVTFPGVTVGSSHWALGALGLRSNIKCLEAYWLKQNGLFMGAARTPRSQRTSDTLVAELMEVMGFAK